MVGAPRRGSTYLMLATLSSSSTSSTSIVRVTIYKITSAITDASARHGLLRFRFATPVSHQSPERTQRQLSLTIRHYPHRNDRNNCNNCNNCSDRNGRTRRP